MDGCRIGFPAEARTQKQLQLEIKGQIHQYKLYFASWTDLLDM